MYEELKQLRRTPVHRLSTSFVLLTISLCKALLDVFLEIVQPQFWRWMHHIQLKIIFQNQVMLNTGTEVSLSLIKLKLLSASGIHKKFPFLMQSVIDAAKELKLLINRQ